MDATLGQFEAKWQEWVEWLAGGDPNSIQKQIGDLVWDAAVLRTFSSAIDQAERDDRGEPKLNGVFLDAFKRWYVGSQCLRIRKLMELYDPLGDRTGKKAVFSLRRVLGEMQSHRDLLTRNHLLRVRAGKLELSSGANLHPDPMLDQSAYRRNSLLDKATGVSLEDRRGDDLVSEHLLLALVKMLVDHEDLYVHINKFIAHAASPESRGDAGQPTYGDLWAAERTAVQVYSVLRSILCDASDVLVPRYERDVFQYIDQPLVSEAGIEKLRQKWATFEKEAASWGAWDWPALARAPNAAE